MKPVILGLSGPVLTADETALFRAVRPAGYIIFAHNVIDTVQLRTLTDDLRAIEGQSELAILIDQEGGRVARLKPPEWPTFPAGGTFDALYATAPITAIEAARCNAEAIGHMLSAAGISVNCAPVLDLRHSDTHAAIGDRSLGAEPMQVAALGRAIIDGLRAGGVAGVIKHMPGQGRAAVDSHHHLPRINADAAALTADIAPFRALNWVPAAMTGHVVFPEWDVAHPATLSARVIADIIRTDIGFDGLLFTDDLHMDALSGDIASRAANAIAAGCDIALACWARGDDVRRIADAIPNMGPATQARLNHMFDWAKPVTHEDQPARMADALARRDALLAAA